MTVVEALRLIVMLVGITLSLTCVKFAYLAIRNGEAYRAWGLASYGLLVVTPSIIGLYRFDQPLIWPALVTYVVSLGCGVVALGHTYTVTPEWRLLRMEDRKRRDRRRAGEDRLRVRDRDRQNVERAGRRKRQDEVAAPDQSRVEQRGVEDTERGRSRGLQDDERDQTRAAEDRREQEGGKA